MPDLQQLSAHENHVEPSAATLGGKKNGAPYSGITLVLPPLKVGKNLKGGKKTKLKNGNIIQEPEVKKAPRPIKLKPLKEVLSKLILQIKKYVFCRFRLSSYGLRWA